MQAFHNDPEIKERLLAQLQAHYEADEIVQGVYWENGKGCDIGCSVHGSSHQKYENQLGIPHQLAHLFDRLFEGLPNAEAKEWPLQHTRVTPVGADLSLVVPRFLVWLLVDAEYGVIRFASSEQGRQAIQGVACLYRRKIAGENISTQEWRSAAYAAADAAAYAADAYDARKPHYQRMRDKLLSLLADVPLADAPLAGREV